jgi:hypothetical protein
MNSWDGGCRGSSFWGLGSLEGMMWQSANRRDDANCGACGCAWGVTAADRNWCRYNEIVFDGSVWTGRLPDLILALFLPTGGTVNSWENGDRNSAYYTRDSFARSFGLEPERVAVLTYDLREAEQRRAPFALLAR